MWHFQHSMKQAEIMKNSEFEQRVEVLLRELLGRVPFLKVKSLQNTSCRSNNFLTLFQYASNHSQNQRRIHQLYARRREGAKHDQEKR